ncbi:MAG TPA: hypothetical protein GX404_09300 [Syntrophomonadaceae bacterium]|nr:hypothetical protein [Syntrophomonadaceae bacterium]
MDEQESHKYQTIVGCFWRDKDDLWEGIFLKDIASGLVQLIKTDNAALILSDQDVEPGKASI